MTSFLLCDVINFGGQFYHINGHIFPHAKSFSCYSIQTEDITSKTMSKKQKKFIKSWILNTTNESELLDFNPTAKG